jgi:hypothetical protein
MSITMDSVSFHFFQSAWNVLGIVGVLLAGAVTLSFLAFRFFSAKWLDTKFSERLESYKHAQQRELEALRFKINGLIDRASKIYGKEYEHLPNLWFELNTAYRSARYLLGGLRQFPDLDTMTPDQLEQFLDRSDLEEWQKTELKAASRKTTYWSRCQDFRAFNKAVEDHVEFRASLSKYAIFFSEDMRSDFENTSNMIWDVIVEYDIFWLNRDPDVKTQRTAREEMRINGEQRLKVLEKSVRDRLWDAERAEI